MSLSALPEWKQLLLERKRREEEERERQEREEEERLASMPAWKRGIIQRRRAKQDEEREREKERDTSKETISPIQQNPFIRSENSFRRDNRGKEVIRDGENEDKKAANNRGRERNKETEKEIWRERDGEMWVEKMGSKSEGRERDRSTGRESRETDSSASLLSPVVGLRMIQANNIIIIEKDKNGKEKLDKREKEAEEEQKRMRMDLREFLAGGGSVTEIRSLREKIRQQEKERRDDDNEEGSREAGRTVREQEETILETLRLFDVTQEVNMTKSSPQLPVPVSLSLLQSASTEREVGEISRDVSESDICPRQAERDVEECGTCIAWRTQDVNKRVEEREEESLEEGYLPPSLSPSPPLSDSLDAMSRIYNLKTVGSRTRGTTITITPRRPAGAASSGGIATVTPAVPKAGKKRYPTAEEIEVIGGYQNLERSCLVKSKGTAKAVSGFLCFCMTYTMSCCAHCIRALQMEHATMGYAMKIICNLHFGLVRFFFYFREETIALE
uniref:Phostensin n=1 Tax=Cyprinus carpio TaxID=7962 RepID=A0A8C1UAY9_CYPCA